MKVGTYHHASPFSAQCKSKLDKSFMSLPPIGQAVADTAAYRIHGQ